MEIRVTPSARRDLLAEVARLRDTDLGSAVDLVEGVEARLRAVAEGREEPHRLTSPPPPSDDVALRMYTRVRGDTLWLLAVWTGE
jgi:hypothetical protein